MIYVVSKCLDSESVITVFCTSLSNRNGTKEGPASLSSEWYGSTLRMSSDSPSEFEFNKKSTIFLLVRSIYKLNKHLLSYNSDKMQESKQVANNELTVNTNNRLSSYLGAYILKINDDVLRYPMLLGHSFTEKVDILVIKTPE